MNKRIEWIDIAKGFSIILVVMGHTGFEGSIAIWLRSFRMPFFFVVSGILFNVSKYPTFIDFIERRRKTVIRPYIFFSLAVFIWNLLLPNPLDLSISELYSGWETYALWFIPVLMLLQIMYYYIRKYCKKDWMSLCCLVLSAIIGFLFYNYKIHFWFKIETIFTAAFYYGIGNICSRQLITEMNKPKIIHLLGMMGLAFIISFITANYNPKTLDLCSNVIGNPLLSYPAAVFGTLFMLCFSKTFELSQNIIVVRGRQLISYIGKNSYVVLAFHQIISVTIIGIFSMFEIPSFVSSIIRHILLWSSLLLLIIFINNHIPWVLGKQLQSQKRLKIDPK